MRTIVIVLVCVVALATQGVAREIDADGCRTLAVTIQLRDLAAEPVEFDSAQLSQIASQLAIVSNAPDLVALAALQLRKVCAAETRQHQPPIYKLHRALLI